MTSMKNCWFLCLALTTILLTSVFGYGVPSDRHPRAVTKHSISRTSFIAAIGGMVACAAPVGAKDNENLKGTKKDPAFEQCLSLCMYECTKPKGAEQKSRAECLPECKEKCATSKAQLLKGEPKSQ